MTILTIAVFVSLFLWLAYAGDKLSRITPMVLSLRLYIDVMVLQWINALPSFQTGVLVIENRSFRRVFKRCSHFQL